MYDNSIIEGRQKIRQWMVKHKVHEDVVKLFENDVYKKGFAHRDLPTPATI
jgi:hypothetical protein